MTFALSYNSQMWRNANGSIWLSGEDLGEGVGWKLQAGSILPVWFNGSIDHYVYADSTGATYRLDQNNGGVWTSLDSTYVAFNANNDYLYFPDGSFWLMNVTSVSSEQDAGTLYPSLMEDTNGNQILVEYAAAAGYGWYSFNTSSRIYVITDARSSPAYTAGYNTDWPPHITGLGNNVGTSENYTFARTTSQLLDPFRYSSFGSATLLQSATVVGLGIAHQFLYDSSGELTQVTTPLGGIMQWAYRTYTYSASGRSYREVQTRYLQLSSGGTQYQWNVGMDNGAVWHGSTTLTDVGANTQKVWTFSTNGNSFPGLATAYEEHASSGTVLLHKDYTWTTDNSGGQQIGRPYVSTVVNKLNPNTSSEADTKTVQTLDTHGNLTQSQAFDYGNLNTPSRTYNYYYLTGSSYTSRNIYNRLTSATVTPAGGSAITVVTNYYDGYPLQATQAMTLHDLNYGTNFVYRGNVVETIGLTSSDWRILNYDSAGVLVQTTDPLNHTVSVTTDSTTNFSLPITVTPNGNTDLQTSMTYASSFAVTSLTGPNGATGTTTYDSYGRPSQTTIPDGAATTYTYNYNPTYQVATLDGRWKKTTLDGFGRTIQVDMGSGTVSDANTVSRVVTQYAPCACSPLLKVWRVSQPYNPNSGSPVWTTYTYDGSGRVLTVTAPDGATTTTSYAGNSTTVTDAAGKWKTKTLDAFGNLTMVTEPNPAGGSNWTTSYQYNALNQLTQASMTRPQGTQTRTFMYTGADMTSATNPENGTVTYTYDAVHHVTSRTDAKGQLTQYTYDSYGRATEAQYYPSQGYEDVTQRVNYTYDQGTNGMGRLTGVQFGGNDWNPTTYSYSYSYNQAGRVLSQGMNLGTPGNYCQTLTATYQWDNEGRMTQIVYPVCQHGYGPPPGAWTFAMQYDTMGRLNGMTEDLGDGPQPVASAGYGPAGQLLNLSYFGVNETRQYNSLLQLTRMTANPGGGANVMDMQYNYSATQNNGRITSSNDYVTGENVSYTYDAVNRLTGASAGSMWGETYSYDGFGNLTGKNVTQPPAPALGVSYDANNHQVGLTYDANGNQSMDAQGATYYNWNVENRLALAWQWGGLEATTWYSYDPWGRRVMKDVNLDPGDNGYMGGAWEYYFYGITGQKLATVSCSYLGSQPNCYMRPYNVYFGGKLVMTTDMGAVVTDRLGSVRNSGGVSYSYFPYGEERTVTPDDTEKFGTYFSDAPGQDYAQQRYYSSNTGGFWSPDPSMDNVDYENPTSWNAYAYVNGDPINFNDPSGLGPVTLPPVVPGVNCSTAFINYAAQFGETIQQLFDTDQGILGVMSYFEQQGSGSSADEKVWAALDWTFINRWNLSASDKAWFFGPNNIPTSFAASVTTGNARSQVFTSSGQLTAGDTTTLLNILTGSPDSKQCAGLADAFDVASGVLEAANGLKAGDPGTIVTPIPDPYPGALQFGSNGAVPSHGRSIVQTQVGQLTDGINVWTFYGDVYRPPPPVRRPPPRRRH